MKNPCRTIILKILDFMVIYQKERKDECRWMSLTEKCDLPVHLLVFGTLIFSRCSRYLTADRILLFIRSVWPRLSP